MITGDHPATGRAIGARLGILDGGEQVMTGAELAEEHATGLADHVTNVAVYARTSPEQKLDIVAGVEGQRRHRRDDRRRRQRRPGAADRPTSVSRWA